eukprot:58635_1
MGDKPFASILVLCAALLSIALCMDSTEECDPSTDANSCLQDIELMYDSHRKHQHSHHPRNLLIDGISKVYMSTINRDFWGPGDKKQDWIIFKIKQENKYYLPKKICIKNSDWHDALHILDFAIGDVSTDKWEFFNPRNMKWAAKFSIRCVDIDGVSDTTIIKNKFKHVKLVMKKNHGYAYAEVHRFKFFRFSMMGTQINDIKKEL